MKRYLNLIILVAILGLALFLRVYKIDTNFYFTGELGKELLYTRSFAVANQLPLVGMSTSHEWLSYGPLYYWILIPLFNLFNGDPYLLFWLALVASALGMILNYLVFSKIINSKVALISTFLQAISPLMIWQTRLSKLHVFFWIFMPIFAYLLHLLWLGNKKWVFWIGIVFGVMFSFHFSQIPLIFVPLLLFVLKNKIYKLVDWFKFFLGVLLPNITLIWSDKNILAWLPYRVINYSTKDLAGTFKAFNEFFGKELFWNERFWFFSSVVTILLFAHYFFVNRKNILNNFTIFFISSSITAVLAANLLHGSPPVHYFLPIFTFIPLLFAIYLEKNLKYLLLLIPVFAYNMFSFNADVLFYKQIVKISPNIDMVPFAIQNGVASFIVKNASGDNFSIKRSGPYDYFPENYSQNYKYLIIYKGGRLVDTSSNVYTIVEDQETGNVNVQK